MLFCWPSQTQLLETVLAKGYGGFEDLLLGELQFAFVAFLVLRAKHDFFTNLLIFLNTVWNFAMVQMGQSLQAFLQWKSLVSLLFGCTEAVSITFQQYEDWIMHGLFLHGLQSLSVFFLYTCWLLGGLRLWLHVDTWYMLIMVRCLFMRLLRSKSSWSCIGISIFFIIFAWLCYFLQPFHTRTQLFTKVNFTNVFISVSFKFYPWL